VVFEAYVKQVLAPSLRPGQVVIVDNLGAHRGRREGEGAHRGAGLLAGVLAALLSPDFSPIEEAFSKLSRRS
jgi:transposase